jgi:putative PEP-CTERM system histidine kinase
MSIGAISYYAGFLATAVLSVLLVISWRGNPRGRWLIVAAAITSVWCLVLGVQEHFHRFPGRIIWTVELLRSYAWLTFFVRLLSSEKNDRSGYDPRMFGFIQRGLWVAGVAQVSFVWGGPWLEAQFPGLFRPSFELLGHVFLALFGLVLVEQYFRNTRPDLRWRIKFLCFALGAIFAYDFYLYSDALLFQRISPDIWAARGAITALLTPLLAISAARNPDWSVDIFVSRQVVFHSVTLIGAGAYLLLMATAGYYIRVYGGEWGTVAQIVFLVGAFLLLALLLLSGQMRAHFRVFFTKNFFVYAYDYRQEWLRIITTLSDTRSGQPMEERVIMVLGEAVESPSGVLWTREASGHFQFRASFGDPIVPASRIDKDDPVVRYMEQKEWIINFEEMVTMPEAYEGLSLPAWLETCPNAWLLVPLPHKEQPLFGVLLLTLPRTHIAWNWEAIDLVKTSSRLAASFLALEDAGRALAEARQFEGFNRLSAFVIHDLKNVIAQLSLVVRNAERHHNNPEFMRDAIRTVDHTVGKMSRLMGQLKNFASEQAASEVEIGNLLKDVLVARSIQAPLPELEHDGTPFRLRANPDRLASAIEHVVHNAQDAAGKHGRVRIRFQPAGQAEAVIEVEDNGPGMDEDFIRSRLFKPFDTTKGLTGMGIGAYESREYLRSIGGDLLVSSEPGKGTLFTFQIPGLGHEAEAVAREVKTT